MSFRTISISTVAALLIAASQAGAQEANHHQHGTPSGRSANMMGMMGMMSNDPAAMCGSMMQSMMNDPVMHKRMNELMRRNMQGTGLKRPMMSMPSETRSH